MLDDDSYDYYGDQQEKTVSPSRWVVFILLLIIGSILVFGSIVSAPPEAYLIYIVFLMPMVLLSLYCAYRWAQGRPIAPTDVADDDRILAQMRAHALPAQRVADLEMYRCPDCEMSFDLSNATPVEENVVLCPICETRLYIE
jgi:hypothetical protein